MTLTDVLIILGVLGFMILGFRDGFLKKVFSILGFWGGFVLGIKFMDPVAKKFVEWMDLSDDTSLIVAFLCIFIVVGLLVNLSYRWYGSSGSESLKPTSRIAGALMGACQGLVAVSLILLLCNAFDIPADDGRKDSLFYDDATQLAPSVFDYSTQWIPESKKFYEEMNGRLKFSKITQ